MVPVIAGTHLGIIRELANGILERRIFLFISFFLPSVRSMYASLLFFQSFIGEAGIDSDKSDPMLKRDSQKYLSVISRLLSVLKRQFLASGVNIDSI